MTETVAMVDPVKVGLYIKSAVEERGGRVAAVYSGVGHVTPPSDIDPEWEIYHHDLDRTVRFLAKHKPVALITRHEWGVDLGAVLTDRLGLPGNDSTLRLAHRDKYLAVQAIGAAGLRAPITMLASTTIDEPAGLQYPVIVKPRNSAASDGCHLCRTPAELRHALACELGRRNIAGTVQDSVVIQEYLAGPQFSANTVSMGGRHRLTEIYEQEIDESGTPPLTRHLLLRTRLGHLEWSVTEFVFACLDALGIREGAAHTEVRIVNGEPALIEMNPRLMGPVMEPDPNFIALGYTQQHVLVDRFLRPAEFKRQLDIPYQPRRALARCQLRAVRSGRVTGLPGLSRLRQLPGFHSVLRLPGYGQILDRTRLNNGTTGVAYLVHESADVLRESLRAIPEMEDVDDLFALAPL